MLMAKKRQTFSKMTRDRELKEKREAKRQKRADRKAAAAGNSPTDETGSEAAPATDGTPNEEPAPRPLG
jgi:hypothetical protein